MADAIDATSPDFREDRERSFAGWLLVILGVFIALAGVAMAAGGIWLISLGGSWYYLLAGIGLAVAGVLLLFERLSGVWLYLAVVAATVLWALWEVGMDAWQLLPRLLALAVLAVVLLFFIPHLRRRAVARRRILHETRQGMTT